MQTHEVRLNYQQASQLVQVGRFDEALEILVEINEVKPNTETILYLMALCQARTGQKEKALELCEQLINEFKNERAQQLKEHLTVPASPIGRSKKEVQVNSRKPEKKEETPQVAEEESEAQSPIPEKQEEDSEGKAEEEVVSEEVQAVEKSPADQVEISGDDKSVQEKDSKDETTADVVTDTEESEQISSTQDGGVPAAVQSKEKQEGPDQDQVEEQVETKTRMQRPLWLVLLWAALLAAVVFCFIYIYFLDSMLNPF